MRSQLVNEHYEQLGLFTSAESIEAATSFSAAAVVVA